MIGYVRASPDDQTLELQRDVLRAEGCERVFEDTPGTEPASALHRVTTSTPLRAGDRLARWRLDRLGRALKDLIALLRAQRGIRLLRRGRSYA